MKKIRQLFIGVLLYSNLEALAQQPEKFDFTPNWAKNDVFTYQLTETKFTQNPQGVYLYLEKDTTYLTYNIKDKTDSGYIVHLNYYDKFNMGNGAVLEENKIDPLKMETYQLYFSPNGEFIELINWEKFAQYLINNISISYTNGEIDSNTLKYYYLYYHSQENVEKAVIPRIIEMNDINGETYQSSTKYNLAREIINPFGGENILKSGSFVISKNKDAPNSVFFYGKITTNSDDLDGLQEDYYNFINEKRPDTYTENAPYIYIVDTYQYQFGTINHRMIKYSTTHTVYLSTTDNTDKQGIDREYELIYYR